MTDPSLLAAAIDIKEPAVRKFLRGRAGAAFAQAAASIVTDGLDDILILRHDKALSALHLIYVFRWADLPEDIMQRPYFQALLGASAFMEEGERGRVLISPGAYNFLAWGIEAAFILEPGGSTRDDKLSEAEMKRFDELLNKMFFDPEMAGLSYSEVIRRPKFFDTKLRKKVDAQLEKHRQRVAIERLPQATALHPVRLCANYHYNGHFMIYTAPGVIRPLPKLEPARFRQRDWGGSDAQHVVVEGRVIVTDPDSFKAHGCGEGLRFYTDSERVYWPSLKPIEGADLKSFKCTRHGFAYDSKRWYYFQGDVLSDVGANGRTDNSLYFFNLTLLIGDRSIYMGPIRLPLDAASFSIRRLQSPRPGGGLALAWFCDKDGDLIVSSSTYTQQLKIERTANPEQLWETLRSQPAEKTQLSQAISSLHEVIKQKTDSPDAQRAFAGFFESWLEKNFEIYRTEQPFDRTFWHAVNNYFYCCGQLGEPAKILDLYPKIEWGAWWDPYIFHHTACAFVAAGDLDAAAREVYRALVYGYEKVDKLLNDPDIAPLFEREDFQRLNAYREQSRERRRPLLPEVLLRTPNLPSIYLYNQLIHEIQRRFVLPDEEIITAAFAGRAAEEQAYRQRLTAFVDDYARAIWRSGPNNPWFKDLYKSIGDVSGLSAIVHLFGAIALYSKGFFWVDLRGDDSEPRPEFAQAVVALERMRASMIAEPAQLSDPLWLEIAGGDVTAPFIAMAEKLALGANT
jgi:hypothetical protein